MFESKDDDLFCGVVETLRDFKNETIKNYLDKNLEIRSKMEKRILENGEVDSRVFRNYMKKFE